MTVRLSTQAQEALLSGLPKIDGKPVLRFDSFTVSLENGEATIEFSHAGQLVFSHFANCAPGERITMTGLNGWTEVSISAS